MSCSSRDSENPAEAGVRHDGGSLGTHACQVGAVRTRVGRSLAEPRGLYPTRVVLVTLFTCSYRRRAVETKRRSRGIAVKR